VKNAGSKCMCNGKECQLLREMQGRQSTHTHTVCIETILMWLAKTQKIHGELRWTWVLWLQMAVHFIFWAVSFRNLKYVTNSLHCWSFSMSAKSSIDIFFDCSHPEETIIA